VSFDGYGTWYSPDIAITADINTYTCPRAICFFHVRGLYLGVMTFSRPSRKPL